MNITKKFVPIAAIAMLAFTAISQDADAGDFFKSRTAHTLYGLTAGLVIGNHIGSNHGHSRSSHHYSYSHHRPQYRSSVSYGRSYRSSSCRSYQPRYSSHVTYEYREPVRERVVYQPVYTEPRYVSPAPANDSYYSYKEKRVFPFYKSVDVEVIPPLPPVQPANSQTVTSSEYARIMRGETQSAQAAAPAPNISIIQNFNGVNPADVETKVEGGEAEVQKNIQPSTPKTAVEEISKTYQNVSYTQSSKTFERSQPSATSNRVAVPSRVQSSVVPNRVRAIPNNVSGINSSNFETSNRSVDQRVESTSINT